MYCQKGAKDVEKHHRHHHPFPPITPQPRKTICTKQMWNEFITQAVMKLPVTAVLPCIMVFMLVPSCNARMKAGSCRRVVRRCKLPTAVLSICQDHTAAYLGPLNARRFLATSPGSCRKNSQTFFRWCTGLGLDCRVSLCRTCPSRMLESAGARTTQVLIDDLVANNARSIAPDYGMLASGLCSMRVASGVCH